MLLAVIFLAACRPESSSGPLVQASLTPTPRSTPLPPVETVVPAGIEENPIQMIIRPPGVASVARRLISDAQISGLQDAILEETGLVVQITLVDRYAEALAALCESTPTRVTTAWLDGLTYQAALAQSCGTPVLQVERDRQRGNAGQIIVSRSQNVISVQGLSGRTFCRLGYEDYYSWLVPSVMMKAGGIDPISHLETVTDYDDLDSLTEAVIDGDCDATGISETAYNNLRGTVRDDLNVIATTPPFPYGVLMYPANLTLGERLRLSDGLITLSNDSASEDILKALLGQDAIVRVNRDDFLDLNAYLNTTGLNFVQMGS